MSDEKPGQTHEDQWEEENPKEPLEKRGKRRWDRHLWVLTYLRVHHGVVPPEDPGGGDVSHQHVDAVVLVSDEDANDSSGAEKPAEPVVPPHPARRV